ncbi:MAG: hypothetical protein MSC31_04430 [Solirubrobacteraceae bacterium MAG38_C4-C5]|nr:hypothetical protein [Candidatus Siliceabacter maunaloa]
MRYPDEVLPRADKDAATLDSDGRPRAAGTEGVIVERPAWHADHRGALTEVVDLSRPFWSEPVVYSCYFTIRPGRIKSWGMHRLQAAQHDRDQLRQERDLVAARLDQGEQRLRMQ